MPSDAGSIHARTSYILRPLRKNHGKNPTKISTASYDCILTNTYYVGPDTAVTVTVTVFHPSGTATHNQDLGSHTEKDGISDPGYDPAKRGGATTAAGRGGHLGGGTCRLPKGGGHFPLGGGHLNICCAYEKKSARLRRTSEIDAAILHVHNTDRLRFLSYNSTVHLSVWAVLIY